MDFSYDPDKSVIISKNYTADKFSGSPFGSDGSIYELGSINYFFKGLEYWTPGTPLNIVDVGAQIGSYSLYAKFLPHCKFFAFEPFPQSYDILNENLKRNNITNVDTYKLGISNVSGEATLSTSVGHNGLHTLGKNPRRFIDKADLVIQTTTLDEFFKNIRIDLLKIDVEGWEAFVLIGGRNVIKRDRPLIQIEWCPVNMDQCGLNQVILTDIICQLGYRIVHLDGEEMILHPWGRFT
jgi:FkbM family methyltransferase